MPIVVRDPEHAFVRMAASGPALELLKQDEATVMEGFCCYHTAIVVGPAMYHLIQFFDELSLRSMAVLPDERLHFVNMPFHRLFAWCDDGLKAERVSPSICSRVRFSHRKLSHGPAKKIKPSPFLIGFQGRSDMGFAWF